MCNTAVVSDTEALEPGETLVMAQRRPPAAPLLHLKSFVQEAEADKLLREFDLMIRRSEAYGSDQKFEAVQLYNWDVLQRGWCARDDEPVMGKGGRTETHASGRLVQSISDGLEHVNLGKAMR